MICDRQLISAYCDGELPPDARAMFERHLANCAECQDTLFAYRELGVAVRKMRVPATPVALRVGFSQKLYRRLDSPTRPRFDWHRPRFVGALGTIATAALIVVAAASINNHPSSDLAIVAAYPPNGATGVVLDDTIEVEFSGAVDRNVLNELAIRLDPPVPVETSIQGSKLVLRPMIPLRADTRYVVRIERNDGPTPGGPVATATPATLNFSTGRVVAAVASATAATRAAAAAATPTVKVALAPATPSPRLTSTAAPTPTGAVLVAATASVVASPVAAVTATVAPPAPTPVVGCTVGTAARAAVALKSQPEIAQQLGCAASAERAVKLGEEDRDGTLVLVIGEQHDRLTLLPNGRWLPGTETPTPTPAAPRPTSTSTGGPPSLTQVPATEAVAVASPTPPAGGTPSISPIPAGPTGVPTAVLETGGVPIAIATVTPGDSPAAPTATQTTAPSGTTTATDAVPAAHTPTAAAGAPAATEKVAATRTPTAAVPMPTAVQIATQTAVSTVKPAPERTGAPATSIPPATPTVGTQPTQVAYLQVFARGSVLAAPGSDGTLGFALFEDGTWARLVATAPPASPTPAVPAETGRQGSITSTPTPAEPASRG